MAPRDGQSSFLQRLDRIDRRWIFLAMLLAVAAPILWVGVTGKTFPEEPTPAVQGAFDAVEALPADARVLISMDFDPASAGLEDVRVLQKPFSREQLAAAVHATLAQDMR